VRHEDEPWSVLDLVELIESRMPKPNRPKHCLSITGATGDETTLELLRVQPREHVSQLVMRWGPWGE